MISVVICSIDKSLLTAVKKNIAATIGLKHEIIAIDNLNTGNGICEVYNAGIKLAKYPILCFLHEDILVETQGWGERVVEIFKDETVGLLGIAGSTYRSVTPSGWFPPAEFGTKPWRLNINQGSKYQSREQRHEYFNPKAEKLSTVSCIDGVWFCVKKEIAEAVMFDEKLLKGFHGYDIDFSLSVGRKNQVLVTYDILLSHASDGNFDYTWLQEIIKVQKKWASCLPSNYELYSDSEVKELEKKSSKRFMTDMIKNKAFDKSSCFQMALTYYKAGQMSAVKCSKFMFKILAR